MQERRQGKDRRRRPTPALSRYTIMGRRERAGRRREDRPGYVDLYHPLLLVVLCAVMLFSVADAWFTLDALSNGAKEVNPLMERVLHLGPASFIAVKLVITGIGLAILCLHKNFPRVKWVLVMVLAAYGILMGYHLYLLRLR